MKLGRRLKLQPQGRPKSLGKIQHWLCEIKSHSMVGMKVDMNTIMSISNHYFILLVALP